MGALFSGPFMSYGRQKCIIFTNFFCIAGSILSLLPFKTEDVLSVSAYLYTGRFLFGLAAGCFSVYCPKYISEVTPIEIKGPAGSITQISITFGILITGLGGLSFGDVSGYNKDQCLWFYNILNIIPLVLSLIQVGLMWTVFPFDTPPMLKQKGDYQTLNTLMGKIYKPHMVQKRIDELQGNESDMDMTNNESNGLSYGVVFSSPLYRKASLVGCTLAMFQQLTGINIIMFYSSKIFGKLNSGLSGPQVTGIVAAVNFVTTVMSLPLLSKFGRKTLMLWGNAAMAIVLLGTGYCSISSDFTVMIGLVMLFIALFEFSSGPITWLYMSEIM